MARIRTIKPEFGQHDKLSTLPAETHLVAALLLPYADDYGYFNAHPKLVHAAICPLRELSRGIPEHLQSLQEIGYLELSTGKDGRLYGKIANFATHQVVSHKAKSKIAPLWNPPEGLRSTPDTLQPEGEVEVEREGEVIPETPPEQHPLNAARRMVEMLGISERILRSVEAAIVAEMQFTGGDVEETAQNIANKAMGDRAKGIPIDRFYFDDTKWRNGNGAHKPTGTNPSRQVERAFSNIAAVATVFGGSNPMAAKDGSPAVEHPRLGDGAGQKARPRAAQPTVLDGEVKRRS